MPTKIAEAGALLSSARISGQRIALPAGLRPQSLGEAYAIQEAIGAALAPGGAQARGWKVGAPNARTEPTAAPIYEVISGAARIPAKRLHMIGVEAEIAAVFERPLPSRSMPYTDEEVLDAVSELRVAIEVCDSRLDDWRSAGDLTKLADHQLNFALVLGDPIGRFRDIDFLALAVRTRVDSTILKEGAGCHAVGNPLSLLPWLANHARTRGGLIAGAAVTTGSWLGMHFIAPGATVVVEFVGVGRAEVEFPA